MLRSGPMVISTNYIPDNNPSWRTYEHSNPNYQLVVVKGDGLRFRRGRTNLVLNENQFLLLLPNETHSRWGDAPPDTGFYFVQFRFPEGNEGPSFAINGEVLNIPLLGSYPDSTLLELSMRLREEAFARKKHYRLRMGSILVEILTLISRHGQPMHASPTTLTVRSPIQAEHVLKVKKYIEKNFCQSISAKNIEAELKLNYEYLCRVFRSATNMTIVDYINRLRIEKATALLLEVNHYQTIEEVARNLGFNNVSYFTRVFKKYMGLTPSSFVRNAYQTLPTSVGQQQNRDKVLSEPAGEESGC